MRDHRRIHRGEKMAALLNVTRSGYYAWLGRGRSRRTFEDLQLVEAIQRIQEGPAKYRYGSPRITVALRGEGFRVGHNRVARLMRSCGLSARPRKKFRVTTKSQHGHEPSPNLLNRQFSVARPNTVWASDISYVATGEGWLYLCVVLDLCGREVVGWSMGQFLGTDLVVKALFMAVLRRRPPKGLLFHSDRGVQYASQGFRRALRAHWMVQSMSRKGNCWDNACVEAFFKTLKTELIGSRIFASRKEAQGSIFEYIEVFYNRQRLHSQGART